jgi:Zn-finger nucleic acid-binding protein
MTYEGTQLFRCSFCAGTLVENGKIPRIIARTGRERPCSERVTALARTVAKANQTKYTKQMLNGGRSLIPLLPCPQCKNSMHRSFYSSAHMIEVDRCSYCGLTWFDQDELEMLQCLIENRIVPAIDVLSQDAL